MHQSHEAHHTARPLHSPEGPTLRLLQVVADYKRLNAVQAAGRAGDRRASGPQYPGVPISDASCIVLILLANCCPYPRVAPTPLVKIVKVPVLTGRPVPHRLSRLAWPRL
jgi:hypothetical protein